MKKIKIDEDFLEFIKIIQLIIAIIYLMFSFLPTDFIKKIIPYGTEIDKLLVVFASVYIINYFFEILAKYFSKKLNIISKILEILIGSVLIFLLDFIPFLIDLKNNQYILIVGLILIVLYSLKILIEFIIKPISNLYFLFRSKKIEFDYKREIKKIEDEKLRKLKEIDLEYNLKMDEIKKRR